MKKREKKKLDLRKVTLTELKMVLAGDRFSGDTCVIDSQCLSWNVICMP